MRLRRLCIDGRATDHWVAECTSGVERLRGVLGRGPLPDSLALRLAPCNAIHSCGLRFALDITFCDRQGSVLAWRAAMMPWRMSAHWSAWQVFEFRTGTLARLGIRHGRRLHVAPCESIEPPQPVRLWCGRCHGQSSRA
ncbi:MAG: DUF192 domain-containing protein [Steroidobacteraceae bacterium]